MFSILRYLQDLMLWPRMSNTKWTSTYGVFTQADTDTDTDTDTDKMGPFASVSVSVLASLNSSAYYIIIEPIFLSV